MIEREAVSGGGRTDHRISRRAILLAVPAVTALATSARSGSIGFGHIPTDIVVPPFVEIDGVAPEDSFDVRVEAQEADDLDDGFIPLDYGWSQDGITTKSAAVQPAEELAISRGSKLSESYTLYVPSNPNNYAYFVITAYSTVPNPPPPKREVFQRRGA